MSKWIMSAAASLVLSALQPAGVASVEATQQPPLADLLKRGVALVLHSCEDDPFVEIECRDGITVLEQALILDPASSEALEYLGAAYWHLAMKTTDRSQSETLQATARAHLRRWTVVDPTNARGFYAFADTLFDDDNRLPLLQKVVQLDPKHPEAHGAIAQILVRSGDFPAAEAAYRSHLEVAAYRGFNDGLEHIRFAAALRRAQRSEAALFVIDATVKLTVNEPPGARCAVFESVRDEDVSADKVLAYRLREIRAACR